MKAQKRKQFISTTRQIFRIMTSNNRGYKTKKTSEDTPKGWIITNDVKRQHYNNAKQVDYDKLKVSQQISKNFKDSSNKHLPVK